MKKIDVRHKIVNGIYYFTLRGSSPRWISSGEYTERAAYKKLPQLYNRLEQRKNVITLTNFVGEGQQSIYAIGGAYRSYVAGRGYEYQDDFWIKCRRRVEMHILPYLGGVRVDDISPAHIEEWLEKLRQKTKLKQSMYNRLLSELNKVLDFAITQSIITHNPCKNIRNFAPNYEKKPIFSKELLGKLFSDNIEQRIMFWGGVMPALFFSMLNATGARLGELRAIMWDDILRVENGVGIYINKTAMHRGEIKDSPKSKSGIRSVPILDQVAVELLQRWQDEAKEISSRLLFFSFRNPQKPIEEGWANRYMQRIAKINNIDISYRDSTGKIRYMTSHSFRWTYNTYYRSVLPAHQLRTLLGHSHEAMSQHYDNADIETQKKRLQEALNQLKTQGTS